MKKIDGTTIVWLWKQIRPERLRLFLLILGNFFIAACSAVFALISKEIIDSAVRGDQERLISYGLFFLAVILIVVALNFYCDVSKEYLEYRLTMDMREDLAGKLMGKEYGNLASMHSGVLLNYLFSDIPYIAKGITTIVPHFVNMFTRLFSALVLMAILDKELVMIFVVFGLLLFSITFFLRKYLKDVHKNAQVQGGITRSFMQEIFENLLVIKVFKARASIQKKVQELQSKEFTALMKRRLLTAISGTGFSFLTQAGYLIVLLWGSYRIFFGTLSFGTLTAMTQLSGQIQGPAANLSGLVPFFYGVLGSSERIIEMEQLEDEPLALANHTSEYGEISSIHFQNVFFSRDKQTILNNLDFSLQKGETVSITGYSGSGKTTLFMLLLGMYKPTSGKVFLRSRSGSVIDISQSRSVLFGYVPQGHFLFSGTLRENISFLNQEATDAEIKNAAQLACIDEFIQSLPEGYETVISERGHGISEGQAQRIAIARALICKPPILLLDEATSALDEQTEEQVLQNLSTLKEVTCLIVTHRKAALKICTKHLILKDGELVHA